LNAILSVSVFRPFTVKAMFGKRESVLSYQPKLLVAPRNAFRLELITREVIS
jgi:hypothetical protein